MMKSKILLTSCILGVFLLLHSCKDYLDRTSGQVVSEEDVFGTFENFQGFIEPMYSLIIDYNSHALTTSMNIGGEIIAAQGWSSGDRARLGGYEGWIGGGNTPILQSNFWSTEKNKIGNNDSGIWVDSWRGIRIANLALARLDQLTDATQEEKDLIAGQAHFFRGWFHFELGRYYGGMPYVDQYLLPADDLQLPRLTWHEMAERIVADLDMAADLLPEDWNQTAVGAQFGGGNAGRITRGAALGFKAKTLLYAGSPLMNRFSNGPTDFDQQYMERAAEAAWEVIQIANRGVYSLTPFNEYNLMFARNDGLIPWSKETIFQKVRPEKGEGEHLNKHGRLMTPGRLGGNNICETVNQLYVDRFEMRDGSIYRTEYDQDNARRWDDRDPRFRNAIYVDRDVAGILPITTLEFFTGGMDDNSSIITPYVCHKFWPVGVNNRDQAWSEYRYVTPHLRLAEIYLIYAEAVNEASGATGRAEGANLTAVDAVNIVRARAGMPPVTAAATGYESFRELIRNERWVELCFEGQWFSDIRRWNVAHLPEYKPYVDLVFDRNWTSFTRQVVAERVFENPRHYWMPIPRSQTQLYLEFGQNPGW
ncbi:RagB/SusD family nutrient uptake outer membrane protein [Neolewinella lacunae]|uniref:RagB/SusD family nutrient uptake outer membrane protein n=1 Tax=Neolewinella lacunae TaxID=1517758 RepID=A0A923T794_9BACT|nr:RagB/SusD family nutrient uptake outer membrane protein [Neolewinella lacunae]MBC6994255.1 RagB/SusD family nutrient uptake outer membrane protein [Neolewinella lacunae]MDN3637127.1 RagB/SusD family nutrient uptake outer membrane protein [Neolewinella lacunae]